jgi:hypothetical protein
MNFAAKEKWAFAHSSLRARMIHGKHGQTRLLFQDTPLPSRFQTLKGEIENDGWDHYRAAISRLDQV